MKKVGDFAGNHSCRGLRMVEGSLNINKETIRTVLLEVLGKPKFCDETACLQYDVMVIQKLSLEWKSENSPEAKNNQESSIKNPNNTHHIFRYQGY
ncbi:hypothetical protein CEXT_375401 [Caerostris extrusa]|uniref:Uncharacterized protein n=1 Tax=Caerostris extrusa TaxID=172846 RepID=A0AAV4XIE8_CAEEX|nr:hypothetical protein CEXT_375401 [Caerostris extrusa]